MKYMTRDALSRSMRKKESVPSDVMVRKDNISTLSLFDDGTRKIKFTISTSAVDRDKDTIAVEGWDLDNYKKNPVVLWAHDGRSFPVGKCTQIGVEGNELKATVEFMPKDIPIQGEFAEAVYRMCKEGYLSATSVGFQPTEYEVSKSRDDGESWFAPLDIKKQELWEFSIVTMPCNPEALIDATERREAEPETTEASPKEKDESAKEHFSSSEEQAKTSQSKSEDDDRQHLALISKKRLGRQRDLELMELGC